MTEHLFIPIYFQCLIPCCSIVLCTLSVDLPAKAIVYIYTSDQPLNPILLLFSAEKDAEEWLNHINSGIFVFTEGLKQVSNSKFDSLCQI